MSKELKLCIYIALGVLAAEILAEMYFAARESSLTEDIKAYLRSNVGRFDQFYAERNRDNGSGASTTEAERPRSDANVDRGNGGSGENGA